MSVSLKHKSLSKKPFKGTNNSEHTRQFIRKTDKFNISVGKEATFKYLVSEHFWHILQKKYSDFSKDFRFLCFCLKCLMCVFCLYR